jgi:hypothetical protein
VPAGGFGGGVLQHAMKELLQHVLCHCKLDFDVVH